MDNDGTKTNLFDPPVIAQYIRVIPVVCRKACTLRMELVGCELNGKLTQKTENMLPVSVTETTHSTFNIYIYLLCFLTNEFQP